MTAEQPDGDAVKSLDARWPRDVVWWDVAFYAIAVLTAVSVIAQLDRLGPRAPVSLAAIAGLVLAYAVLGRRAARSRDQGLALAYLLTMMVLVCTAIATTAGSSLLLFIGFSQIWMLIERTRTGVVLVVLLAVGATLAMSLPHGPTLGSLARVAAEMAVVLVFAIGLGLWVAVTMRQAERYAVLVDELRATQAALAASHHAAGVTAERERMAREIHDTLAQGFTSVVMLSQTARSNLEHGRLDQARDRMDLVERTARDNLAEARALVAAFAPVGLQEGSLAQALARLAERFTQETGVVVEVVVPEQLPPLDREREVVLLRAAQEALSNVRRHADAHRVRLVLREGPGQAGAGGAVPGCATGTGGAPAQARTVHLEVVDDGRGFDPVAAGTGLGLRGMRERVTAGGGDLSVESSVGDGTRVRVSLPLAVRAEDEERTVP
ncbi:sensor histidine kinase [Actinotalea sp. BY-33]|uniref:Oxygen sensor histidine kinase NreB n=1 Tax=Actinotalea soli TaxID=2819234 RepID=A0A939LR96_9CELL|nr:sensor histidine kinase [Actinotalea soli]MBO1752373.1 sensor histidine kinase [Actinotalea soli]